MVLQILLYRHSISCKAKKHTKLFTQCRYWTSKVCDVGINFGYTYYNQRITWLKGVICCTIALISCTFQIVTFNVLNSRSIEWMWFLKIHKQFARKNCPPSVIWYSSIRLESHCSLKIEKILATLKHWENFTTHISKGEPIYQKIYFKEWTHISKGVLRNNS